MNALIYFRRTFLITAFLFPAYNLSKRWVLWPHMLKMLLGFASSQLMSYPIACEFSNPCNKMLIVPHGCLSRWDIPHLNTMLWGCQLSTVISPSPATLSLLLIGFQFSLVMGMMKISMRLVTMRLHSFAVLSRFRGG